MGLVKGSAHIKLTTLKALYSDPYQRFIALLRQARQAADLTQAELSKQLGRPQSFVSKYERGERRLDVVEFMEICERIGVEPLDMMRKIKEQRD